jgi:hypothetical protein
MSAQSLFTNKTTGNIGLSQSVTGTLPADITTSGTFIPLMSVVLNEGTYIVEFLIKYEFEVDTVISTLHQQIYVDDSFVKGETRIYTEMTSVSSTAQYEGCIDKVVYVPTGATSTVQVGLVPWGMTGTITFPKDPSAHITKIA